MKIELTETELIHIMDSLNERAKDLRDCDDPESLDLANELEELEHDLFEHHARHDDPSWQQSAEARFIQAGIDAREAVKAQRRESQNFGEFEVSSNASSLKTKISGRSRAAERRTQRLTVFK